MGKITTSIYLDKRRKKLNSEYPVKLRVTYNRKQKYYPLNISMHEDEYEKMNSAKPRLKYKEMKLLLAEIENKAVDVINKLPIFSFNDFERLFLNESEKAEDVFGYFESYIGRLRKQQRIGTADSYNNAYHSLQKYCKEYGYNELKFHLVDVNFLEEYENWMTVKNGNSITTVGIYLRCLRTLFNEAIEGGLIDINKYPFGKRKYVIPRGLNIKRALSKKQVESIINFQCRTLAEERARDLWVLSYALNGIQMKDLAQLKFKNIDDQAITYFRAKTIKTSKKELTPIRIPRHEIIDNIIEKWQDFNAKKRPEKFIFDILNEADDEEIIKKKTRQLSKTVNKYLGRIGEDLGIPFRITTRYARHSAATILMNGGATLLYISKHLGHHNTKTTEIYLDSFSDDIKEDFQSKLFDFK